MPEGARQAVLARGRLVVVGSANLDVVLSVPALPRPGETVVATAQLRAAGGKGANQAVAAARLGADVRLVAAVGDDAAGGEILQALQGDGLGIDVEIVPGVPSGTAVVVVDADGDNTVTVVPGANSFLRADTVGRRAALHSGDTVLLQLEIPLETNLAAAKAAKRAGAHVLLNAAPAVAAGDLAELLGLTDVLVVNEGEAVLLAGSAADASVGAGAGEAAGGLLESGPELVVVTLGAAGSLAVTSGTRLLMAAPVVAPVDTVGAGDAFCAGLAVARAEGQGLEEALAFANACGALATTVRGAQPSFARRPAVLELVAQALPEGGSGRR